MPTYSAKCQNCGNTQTYRRSIDERNDTPICCEVRMAKVMDAPAGNLDWPTQGRKSWGKPSWQRN
jgi:predicted nucleic acid-binding Zn ribbon protein